jgi:hypothetical protein
MMMIDDDDKNNNDDNDDDYRGVDDNPMLVLRMRVLHQLC